MKEYSYTEAISFFRELPHFKPPKNDGMPKKDLFSLDAELALLAKLDNPQNDLQYVHVAGTNGKGSTVAYISSVVNQTKYIVGTFASPFLYHYNELFVVGGEEISDEDFAAVFSEVKPAYDELTQAGIYPSEYEILTTMGFLYFKRQGCDLVVLEVSLGGRMDTTNVIPAPLVTVITPINYDHMSILGNTLAEIATEKAGIIKTGSCVVSAPQEPEVQQVLEEVCMERSVLLDFQQLPKVQSLSLEGQQFQVEGHTYTTSLLGTYQVNNAALAILVIRKLQELGFRISEGQIAEGIAKTKWFGRFTLIHRNPYIIVDGGHNRQGAKVLRQSIEAYFPDQKITFVMGILKDKEVDIILDELLPIAKMCYTMEVPSMRTMNPIELAEMIAQRGITATVLPESKRLSQLVEPDEVLCICGSLYLIQNIEIE